MKFIVKIHKHPDSRIFLTVCDKNIIGRKFSEGELMLDLTSAYYQGDEREADIIIEWARKSASVSFAGEESVKLGVENGIIEKESIVRIEGIPTAMAMIL